MRRITPLLIAFSCLGLLTSATGQHLTRRPFLGVMVSPVSDSLASASKLSNTTGAQVMRVIPNSTAASLKLQPNDIIVRVNDNAIREYMDVPTLARSFKTGEPVTLAVVRNGKTVTVKGNVQPMPYETSVNADVLYGEVPLVNNGYARSIMKKPKGTGKYPAVFFIQGYGCATLDNLPEQDSQRQLMDGLVAKGYAVYRMEKPGMGDSQGTKPCQEIGYKEELAAFASGLAELKKYDFVDTDNIFLFGHSLGANTAPIIASDNKVKGIITYGAAGKPWLEYMIEVFREQRPIGGVDYVQVDEDMKTLLPMVYEFMVLKKTPEELVKNPAYKRYMENNMGYDGRGHVFGRHYTFLQELNDIPVMKAWKDAGAYTLAIYGEADVQAIDPDGAKLIASVVNHYHPGKGTYEFLPRTDHGFIEVGTQQDYLRQNEGRQPGTGSTPRFNPKLVELVDTWMKDKLKKS